MKIVLVLFLYLLNSALILAQNPQWTVYNKDNSNFPGGKYLTSNAYDIKIDSNGHKWVGTSWGVAIFTGIEWEHWHGNNSGLTDAEFYALEIVDDSTKWFGSFGSGLFRLKGAIWDTFTTANSGIPSNYVRGLDIDANSTIWIGTYNGGVAHYDENHWEVFTTANSDLSSNEILSIYCDNEDIIWAGTYNGGLNRFDGEIWTTYNTANSGLPDNIVQEVEKDKDGALWICTWGGVARFIDNNWISYSTPDLPHHVVRSIHIDRYNNKWFGTENGVVKFDNIDWKIITDEHTLLQGGIIGTLITDTNDCVWIGTSMQGVFVYDEFGIVNPIEFKSPNKNDGYILEQNFPNPFNPSTVIKYRIPKANFVTIKMYNIVGREIETLVHGFQTAGDHEIPWQPKSLPGGIYFCRLKVGFFTETKKLILQR